MARITELLYSAERHATVAVVSDGMNYVLPVLRDPKLIARFCQLVRNGQWELSYTEEGMEMIRSAPDLETQKLSF